MPQSGRGNRRTSDSSSKTNRIHRTIMRFDRQCLNYLMGETNPDPKSPQSGLPQITIVITFAAPQSRTFRRKSHTRNDQQINRLRRTKRTKRTALTRWRWRRSLNRIDRSHPASVRISCNDRFLDTERTTNQCIRTIIVKPHRISFDPRHDDPFRTTPATQRFGSRRFVGQCAETGHTPCPSECRKRLHLSEYPLRSRSLFLRRQLPVPAPHRSSQFVFRHKIAPFPKKSETGYCYSANNGYICIANGFFHN